MTTDTKLLIFGPSGVFDPAAYDPRSGKTFWMASTDTSSLTDKELAADTLIDNCTASISLKSGCLSASRTALCASSL